MGTRHQGPGSGRKRRPRDLSTLSKHNGLLHLNGNAGRSVFIENYSLTKNHRLVALNFRRKVSKECTIIAYYLYSFNKI